MNKSLYFVLLILITAEVFPQENGLFQIARLKYSGGSDWYNDPSAEVNLLSFINNNTTVKTNPRYVFVEASSDDLYNYPFIFVTGHGNIVISDSEADRINTYLKGGGFVYFDDDYGMWASFKRAMKKVFPDKDFVEIPFSHGIYNSMYEFESGPPKTHEHDNKTPQGFGLFIGERLAVYATVESNPSDGWADEEVHNDPQEKRIEALRFGTNIVIYALTN